MQFLPSGTGWIEVITGCMFSGKTEELIRRLRRAQYARQHVVVFKPKLDTRYSKTHVVSHDEKQIESYVIQDAPDMIPLARDAQVVGIDEGQFFGPPLVEACEELANSGKRVIVAGLDQDFRGQPFEPIPHLLAVAEYITKNLAICMVCGNPADRSQRIVNREARFLVGATDMYEARCRRCFVAEKPGDIQESLPL
jgi:thymidine kinase